MYSEPSYLLEPFMLEQSWPVSILGDLQDIEGEPALDEDAEVASIMNARRTKVRRESCEVCRSASTTVPSP